MSDIFIEEDTRDLDKLETLQWTNSRQATSQQIDQFLVIARYCLDELYSTSFE